MKILFVGGGTLGHIYPSFSVIDIIKQMVVLFILWLEKEKMKLML